MKILFVSIELIGSALIHRLLDEGHDVRLYIDDPSCKHCLDGFVEKTLDWKAELGWVGRDGLIIFDDVGWKGAQDRLREDGYRVVGGSSASDRLELDRGEFTEILRSNGVEVLPSYSFESVTSARQHIISNPGRWVVKQPNHLSTATYVGMLADGQDVLEFLDIYSSQALTPICLQPAVEGVEIAVARFFNGNDWVGPVEYNIEHKELCVGGIGPLTHEMGTLMWYDLDESRPLFSKVLAPLKGYLCQIGYKGNLDINCIVNEKGIWPLEATARFGSPATQAQCELHVSPWGELLAAIADGKPYELQHRSGFAVVITVAMPPFPYADEFFRDRPLILESQPTLFISSELKEDDVKRIYLEEFIVDPTMDKKVYNYAGSSGYALFVTGWGSQPEEARTNAYNVIQNIHLPRMFYRSDIATKFICEDREQLSLLGLL